MIHVEPRPAPADFDAKVRGPGTAWLAAHPPAHKKKLPEYWRRALPDLRREYKGICAYFCCFVMPATGARSTDHFVPKVHARGVAYEWSNYRFACSRMNSRKRDARDVLDRFSLADGWFELYFPTMRVRPSRTVPTAADGKAVRDTIERLGLNSQECVTEREHHWDNYAEHGLSAARLMATAPFVAMEAARQGLLNPADQGVVTVATIRAWLDS